MKYFQLLLDTCDISAKIFEMKNLMKRAFYLLQMFFILNKSIP